MRESFWLGRVECRGGLRTIRFAAALAAAGFLLAPALASAQDATWTGATSGSWTNASNWSPASVPTGTARFAQSSITTLTGLANQSISTLRFDSNASAYVFNVDGPLFSITGTGIANLSATRPTLNVGGGASMHFLNSSSAANATIEITQGVTSSAVTQFHGSSTAANATVNINSGELYFKDNSSAGNARIVSFTGAPVFPSSNAAGVLFLDSSSAAQATIINNGTGEGAGRTTFAQSSSAGDAVIVNNRQSTSGFFGSTFFESASTAANANITNNGGATLFQGGSAGAATIVNNAGGVTVFGSTFDGGPSTAANATIITNAGGQTLLQNSASGGQASFVTNGGGIFDMSSMRTAGTTAGSIAGAGRYFLGAKNLAVGGNNASTTVDGIISDGGTSGGTGGSLVKLGAGTLTLSGVNTYTGATAIDGGTLSVNGSIASSSLTTVNAGATLAGNGAIGNTLINGGTLAPGNSIGTLTVQGSLTFTAASSYMVEVSPANADRTNVTGTATLGGAAVKASFAAGTYVAKQYTIVNATGGVSGTFNSVVNTNVPANFTSSLSYDANNAYLNLALNFIPPPNMGLNVNQQNVANAIVGFFNANGGIPLVFGGLTAAGLTQASGELPTAAQQTTFDAMNLFLGLLTDPFIAGRGNPVSSSAGAPQFADESDTTSASAANGKARSKSEREAYAAVYRKATVMADPFTQRWSVWAAGYGGSQTTDGNTVLGSNNTRSSIGGVAVGADYRFSPNTLAGFALAGGGTSFSVNGLGSGRSDLFQAGAFVRHTAGPAYLSAALAYGWQDITTDRTVTIAGTDLLRAKFNANAFSGRVEGGYRFVTPWMAMGLTPYAAGQFTTFDLPAYAEQAVAGANTFALTYGAKDATASRSELGLRSDKSWAMQSAIFTLRGRAAWAHNFNTDRNVAATFQTLPGASFVVNGARQASDSALVTGSAEMKWLNGFSLAGTFEGEFSNVTTSYAGKGVARYAW
jgi:autotransporter-associated beta strand protein